jgi:hypothetical protein
VTVTVYDLCGTKIQKTLSGLDRVVAIE